MTVFACFFIYHSYGYYCYNYYCKYQHLQSGYCYCYSTNIIKLLYDRITCTHYNDFITIILGIWVLLLWVDHFNYYHYRYYWCFVIAVVDVFSCYYCVVITVVTALCVWFYCACLVVFTIFKPCFIIHHYNHHYYLHQPALTEMSQYQCEKDINKVFHQILCL